MIYNYIYIHHNTSIYIILPQISTHHTLSEELASAAFIWAKTKWGMWMRSNAPGGHQLTIHGTCWKLQHLHYIAKYCNILQHIATNISGTWMSPGSLSSLRATPTVAYTSNPVKISAKYLNKHNSICSTWHRLSHSYWHSIWQTSWCWSWMILGYLHISSAILYILWHVARQIPWHSYKCS